MALKDNGPLGGGSPWEVPWGEIIGPDSFETLSKIYTGYGDKGPSQAVLNDVGVNDARARFGLVVSMMHVRGSGRLQRCAPIRSCFARVCVVCGIEFRVRRGGSIYRVKKGRK